MRNSKKIKKIFIMQHKLDEIHKNLGWHMDENKHYTIPGEIEITLRKKKEREEAKTAWTLKKMQIPWSKSLSRTNSVKQLVQMLLKIH